MLPCRVSEALFLVTDPWQSKWFPGFYRVPPVAGRCSLTLGFVAIAPQVTSLRGLAHLCGPAADEASPTPNSRKPRVQGASPTTKPTHSHSLPQTCSSTPLLLLPPLPLLTGLLTGSPWNSGPCLLIEHTHQKDKMTTLPSSPHPHLCSLCFNYWADLCLLISCYWLRVTSHNFMLEKLC